jgi:type II secretory pathway predicted ATPase ExeA/tetratricopeptide (TPR) repeat protein
LLNAALPHQTIKIFLAYSEESKAVPALLRERLQLLDRDPDLRDIRFTLDEWRASAPLGFNAAGPQGQIDPLLDAADVIVFVFRSAIGPGLQHEFNRALERRRMNGGTWPEIMVLFASDVPTAKTPETAEAWAALLRFRHDVSALGLHGEYQNDHHLVAQVVDSLRHRLRSGATHDALRMPRHSLPAPLRQLIGRHEHLESLLQKLRFEHHRRLAVTGLPGIGKTTLTRHAVQAALEASAVSRAIWIDLSVPFRDAAALEDHCISELARSFEGAVHVGELVPHKRPALMARLRRGSGTPIVVLDNLEKILETRGYGALVRGIVEELPSQCRVLLLSQQPLAAVPELRDLRAYEVHLGALSREDSQRLIESKAGHHSTTPLSRESIEAICDRAGGVPLLIEWLVEIALADLTGERLSHEVAAAGPEAFESSIQRILLTLDENTRRVWDHILVGTRSGYRLSAESIAALNDGGDTAKALERLASYPLISFHGKHARVIEGLSGVSERLVPSVPEESILERIAAHYLAVVSVRLKLRLESYDHTAAYRELLPEKDNFVRAMDYYIAKAPEEGHPLAYRRRLCLYQFTTGVSWFLWIHGFVAERVRLLTAAIEIATRHQEEPEKCLANINDVAWTHYHLGDKMSVNIVLSRLDHEMLQLVQKSNSRYGAMLDRLRANVLMSEGRDGDKVVELLNGAAVVFDAIGERRRVASVRSELGLFYYSREEYGRALELYADALARSIQIGETHSLSIYHWRMGEVLIALFRKDRVPEHLDQAVEHLEKGLEASQSFRRQSEAHIRACLAKALFLKGTDASLVMENLAHAERTFREMGDEKGLRMVEETRRDVRTATTRPLVV